MSLHIFPSYRLLVHWSNVYTWQIRYQATRKSAVLILIDAFRPLMLFTYIDNRLLASLIANESQINKMKARSCDNPRLPVAWQPVPFTSRKTCWNSDESKSTRYCRVAPFITMAGQPYWAKASSLSRFHDHTQTYDTRFVSSGWRISPSQRTVPDITQHSQRTDIYASGRIRTGNPSNWAAADARFRPRGHWDRRAAHLDYSQLDFTQIEQGDAGMEPETPGATYRT